MVIRKGTLRIRADKMEEARKRVAKTSAYKSGYGNTMDELEDKCASLLAAGRAGSKAKAIRAYCYACMGGYYPSMVRDCSNKGCFLWRYRMGRGNQDPGEVEIKKSHFYWDIVEKLVGRAKRASKSRLQAIRLNCHMCVCSTGYQLIETCEVYNCPVWRYRMGRGNEDPREIQEANKLIEEFDAEDDFQY